MPEAKLLNCLSGLKKKKSLSQKKKFFLKWYDECIRNECFGIQEIIRLNLENILNIFLP